MTSIMAVAEYAGVSIATVSRVLNDTKYVSPAVRARVLEAIGALNYQPSVPARSLRLQQTQSIGVLLPQLNDFYFSNLAFVLEKALSEECYSPLFASTEGDPEKEAACIDLLSRNRVEGAVLVPTLPVSRSKENINRLVDRGVAVVLVDRGLAELNVNQVRSDNFQGGADGMRHLLVLGHRQIGFLDSRTGKESLTHGSGHPGHERISGARHAAAEAGLPFREDLVKFEDLPNTEMGYYGTLKLLRECPDVTAIFAITDAIAVGVLRAAYELNMNVPRDLSVLGFDDIPLASHVIPRLTTVAQSVERIGRTAADLLLRQIREPDEPRERIMVATQLVVRESTAPPSH